MTDLTSGNDTFPGTSDDDLVNGLGGNDSLSGGDGNDTLDGGGGRDTIAGGVGDDVIRGGGTDFTERDVLVGDAGNDTISSTGIYNDMHGGAGNDSIVGGAFSLVEGGAGADVLKGVAGLPGSTLSYASSARGVTINIQTQKVKGGDAKGDTISGFVNAEGSANDDVIRGSDFFNSLKGLAGDDSILGGAGNDVISGGDGNDTLDGGTGDDVVQGGAGVDQLKGGEGADRLSFENELAAVTVNLAAGTGTGGSAQGDSYTSFEGVFGSLAADTLIGDKLGNNLDGNLGDDRLVGGGGNDSLRGASGNDTIVGGAGGDSMQGGAGGDSIDGGAGNDTLDFGFIFESVQVNLAAGAGTGGEAEGDVYKGIENVFGGVANDTIVGSAAGNILDGASGDDSLSGGGGADRFEGDSGADTFDGGAGADWLDFSSAFTAVDVDLTRGTGLGGDADGDVYEGIENIAGGSGDDTLKGDKLANRIEGDFGDDILNGGVGNDTLNGDFGADLMTGGKGRDVFVFAVTPFGDTIADFEAGTATTTVDRIDLREIDAKPGGADNAFRFIGTRAFDDGVAGQLRVFRDGVNTVVEAQTDTDPTADFSIVLKGKIPLASITADDFFL